MHHEVHELDAEGPRFRLRIRHEILRRVAGGGGATPAHGWHGVAREVEHGPSAPTGGSFFRWATLRDLADTPIYEPVAAAMAHVATFMNNGAAAIAEDARSPT